MNRIGFILRPDSPPSHALLETLVPWLISNGREAVLIRGDADGIPNATVVEENTFSQSVDLAVALGGDGTILRAGQAVGAAKIPVLGINLGHLGFLTAFGPDHAKDAIDAAVAGTLPRSRRTRLEVKLTPLEGPCKSSVALNDVVIHQRRAARLIELHADFDGEHIASYRADGLIVATPSGSTAYNLAAGGAIMMPEVAAMALTPISAHALTMRPLILPASGTLTIRLGEDCDEAAMTVDGQVYEPLGQQDRIEITTAPPLVVFGSPNKGYFDILREKLHWGVREHYRKP